MDHMAEEVARGLDVIGIQTPIVLIGISMGGYVCFSFLKKFSQRLKGLVLVSTRATADSESARAKRFDNIKVIQNQGTGPLIDNMSEAVFGETTRRLKRPLLSQTRTWMEENRSEGIMAALRGMAERPDSTPLLSKIQVPTLVVSGGDDPLSPPSEMEGMSNLIPGAEFHVMPATGHLLPVEQPQEFSQLLIEFVERKVLGT